MKSHRCFNEQPFAVRDRRTNTGSRLQTSSTNPGARGWQDLPAEKVAPRLFCFCALFLLFTCSFVWGSFAAKAYFAIAVLCLLYLGLCRSPLSVSLVVGLGIPIVIINTVSTLSGNQLCGLPLNYSWWVQVLLHATILVMIEAIVRQDFDQFRRICLFCLKCSCIPLIAFAMYRYRHWAPDLLLSLEVQHALSYRMVGEMSRSLGLEKQMFPWFASCLTLLALPVMGKLERIGLPTIVIVFVWFVRTKAVMAGLVVVGVLYAVRHFRYRLAICTLLCLVAAVGVLTHFEAVNEILIGEGRFLFPVLTSAEFWRMPMGCGMGNYGHAILAGAYGDNRYAHFVDSRMYDALDVHLSIQELYPVAESDVLVIGAAFGWLGGGIIVVLFVRALFSALARYDSLTDTQKTGMYLLGFLFGASLFQDWFLGPFGWFFYSVAIGAILVGGPSPGQSSLLKKEGS